MKWFDIPGKMQEYVISSRTRLARNIDGLPYESKLSHDDFEIITKIVGEVAKGNEAKGAEFKQLKMADLSHLEKLALFEKRLISSGLVKSARDSAVYYTADYGTSVMIGEEDHLRMQTLSTGLDFETLYKNINKMDEAIGERLDYAYDSDFGYLTACPTNLGTGFRASAMLHLPALEVQGLMPLLTQTLANLGFTVRGTFGEGTKAIGGYYQVSNQITLGITEVDAIIQLQNIIDQIIEKEASARDKLRGVMLEDRVMRAYGVITHAKVIEADEFMHLISLLRLGITEGHIKNVSYNDVDKAIFMLGDANISLHHKGKNKNIVRTSELKRLLNKEKKEVSDNG